MANSYFQFKQFKVEQEHCAMKVSTEACILGAWVPTDHTTRILDIGAGTGLISLMLAQRSSTPIDAVEIDADAAIQATKNFTASQWSDRLCLFQTNVLEWKSKECYDLIVSNPPFFTSSLKSSDGKNNLAKHDTGDFSKDRFAKSLDQLLTNKGVAYVLYPEVEAGEFSRCCGHIGLYTAQSLIVHNQVKKPTIFRVITKVTREPIHEVVQILNIREGQEYTPEFVNLLKEYYLKF